MPSRASAGRRRPDRPAAPARLPRLDIARHALLLLAAALLAQWPWGVAARSDPVPAGFLWEATRGNERVLLFGSMHVGRPDAAAAYRAERTALRQAQVFVFEADVFDAQATLAATQRWAMYAEGRPGLDAHVDAVTLARMDRVGAQFGGAPLCCRMKPWMVANTLVMLEAMRAGLDPAYGSEAQLHQLALANRRPIAAIESIDEQLRLFDEAAPAVQVDYLRHTLETLDSGAARAEIERLVAAWARGDEASMERLVAEMTAGDRAAQRFVADRVLRGRHPKMAAAIERFGASDRLHLVVIGALHYFGPDGLLAVLRGRGYRIERVP